MQPRSFLLRFTAATLATLTAATLAAAAEPEAPNVTAGRRLAERYCGECHATGVKGLSPLAEAPPFATLHHQFDAASLPLALEGGMLVGHPRMPLLELDPDQVEALTAYMKSLAPTRAAVPQRQGR